MDERDRPRDKPRLGEERKRWRVAREKGSFSAGVGGGPFACEKLPHVAIF